MNLLTRCLRKTRNNFWQSWGSSVLFTCSSSRCALPSIVIAIEVKLLKCFLHSYISTEVSTVMADLLMKSNSFPGEKRWWFFVFPTPVSQYSESLDVIPGLFKSRGAFSEEEFGGEQFIPKWPVLFLISEFYKELQKD